MELQNHEKENELEEPVIFKGVFAFFSDWWWCAKFIISSLFL